MVCRLSVWATLIYSDVQKSLMRAQGLWPPLGSLKNSTGLHRLLMISKLFHHLFGDSGLLTGANNTYDSPRRLYSLGFLRIVLRFLMFPQDFMLFHMDSKGP